MNRKALGLFIIVMLLSLSSCIERGRRLVISFTGDIIMHIPVKSCALRHNLADSGGNGSLNNGGFDFLFERIAPVLRESDCAVGNMEFPVAPPFESRPFIFNCRPEVLGALKRAGFCALSIANNHILDQGAEGFHHTLEFLDKNGMRHIGGGPSEESARSGIVVERRGIRAGIISYAAGINTGLPAGKTGVYVNMLHRKEKLIEDIAAMKKRCDYLVMIAHLGSEYSHGPAAGDEALIRQYCDAGVDCVIGHHPHVVQRIEPYVASDGRPCHIFYSLGNFISNQSSEVRMNSGAMLGTRDSVIVRLVLERKGEALSRRFELVPIRTVNEIEKSAPGPYTRSIQPVAIGDEIRELEKAAGKADDEEQRRTRERIEQLNAKIDLLREVLTQGKAYSDVSILKSVSKR